MKIPEFRVGPGYSPEELRSLRAGDEMELTGIVYTARDQVHRRLVDLLAAGSPVPLDLQGAALYYTGAAPAPPGAVIGSCGPTTSARMDPFTPTLLERGVVVTIGKGPRSPAVTQAIRHHGAVYFHAYGGCGALYAERVVRCVRVGFDDLGPEAMLQLQVEGFPVIVGVDSVGGDLFSGICRPGSR